jgi:hypothetical protein
MSQVPCVLASVEFNMTRKNLLLARLSGGLSLAVLAAAFSFGGPSAVRAADEEVLTPALLELIVNPIVKTVEGLQQRLTHLEASVGGWADSLMARRAVVHEICLADDNGAQTCISKEQLDALIRKVALAEIAEPVAPAAQANSAAAAEPVVELAAEPVAPPAAEPVAAPSEPVSAQQAEANAAPASETVVVVVPIEAISIPVTEPNAPAIAETVVLVAPSPIPETETNAPPVAELGVPAGEPAAIAAPAGTVPVTPIALPAENSPEAQELEYTGTIVAEAPAAPVAPLAEAPAAQITDNEEAPGQE